MPIDTAAAKAAPGVLAVLTGADWKASGFGDLPVRRRPQAPRRLADVQAALSVAGRGPRALGRRLRRLRRGRDLAQAQDAAELIEVDYEPLPAVTSTAEAAKPGAPRVWDDCPDNICFVELIGDKAATDAAFARADHVVKHQLRHQPRHRRHHGAARRGRRLQRGRRPLHHLHDAAARRIRSAPSSPTVLKVPESKVRVVAGDIGGSFGMKSAVYNEARWCCWRRS